MNLALNIVGAAIGFMATVLVYAVAGLAIGTAVFFLGDALRIALLWINP